MADLEAAGLADREPVLPACLLNRYARNGRRRQNRRIRTIFVHLCSREPPVTTGPGDGMAPTAGGHGRLRASHADREQVIGTLKAAYVQGRLTKHELDTRVGQTLAARTYADLGALTADLPAGLTDVLPPRRPTGAPAWSPMSKVVAGAALIVPPPAMVAAAFLSGSEKVAIASALVVVVFSMACMVAGAQMLANWHDNRSGKRLPPPSAQRGPALEHRQHRGIGDDLILCQARSDVRPGHLPGDGAILRAWRSVAIPRQGVPRHLTGLTVAVRAYFRASRSSRQACSQRRQACSQNRQCACICACRSPGRTRLLPRSYPSLGAGAKRRPEGSSPWTSSRSAGS